MVCCSDCAHEVIATSNAMSNGERMVDPLLCTLMGVEPIELHDGVNEAFQCSKKEGLLEED